VPLGRDGEDLGGGAGHRVVGVGNCYNVFDAAMPFGGYEQSGWGREMGREALELYTETKSACLRL